MKRCTKCGEAKPATREFFSVRPPSRSRDGLDGTCKTCTAAYTRAHRAPGTSAHAQKTAAVRSYYREHRDDVLAKLKTKRRDPVAQRHISSARRAYYERERDRITAQRREYYAKHKARIAKRRREADRGRRERDREAIARYGYEWRQRNPERWREYRRKRRAGKTSDGACDFTVEQWDAVRAASDGACVYCGRRPRVLTVDHVEPLTRGGDHSAHNIVPACRSCNSSKNRLLLLEWAMRDGLTFAHLLTPEVTIR